MIVTDSIQLPSEKQFDKVEVISVGHLMGSAIRQIYTEQSVGKLFVKEELDNTQA